MCAFTLFNTENYKEKNTNILFPLIPVGVKN